MIIMNGDSNTNTVGFDWHMGCNFYPIGLLFLIDWLSFCFLNFKNFLFMAKVCCSIESEPRTLSEGELNHARELAADVVEKMEPNEASAIFIQGLRPVGSMKEMVHMIAEEGEQLQSKVVGWKKEEAQILETPPCQCLCPTANIESPDQARLTEPLSAPF